jgi:hypothetical protein
MKGKSRIKEISGMSRAVLIVAGGAVLFILACGAFAYAAGYLNVTGLSYYSSEVWQPSPPPVLDKRAYDIKLLEMANATTTISTTTLEAFESTTTATSSRPLWPVKTVYPNYGALLPFDRIVAYYGNFLSKGMGVLGEYPTDEMLAKLEGEVAKWQAADPSTPVIPAIHYIAVTAQGTAGRDGTYRARMSDSQIDHAVDLANQIHGIVFLDIQVGLSDLRSEIPELRKYLAMPQVHLAIDPEFAMQKSGMPPGTVVGTFDAKDINYAAQYLAELVREYKLPPKILIVHRYTNAMVTNYQNIQPLPEVQIVMDMDGWGSPAKKLNTYAAYIQSQPVQFTGFKLFYKNDIKPPSTRMLTPEELLQLKPQPVYIQYQ